MRNRNVDIRDQQIYVDASRHSKREQEDDEISYPETTAESIIDIITAYKSLKLAMCKNSKGLNVGREEC